MGKLFPRLISLIIMSAGFMVVIVSGNMAIVILGVILQAMMYKEITHIALRRYLKGGLKTFGNVHWFLFCIAIFYFNGKYALKKMFNEGIFSKTIMNILSLKKGYYRQQFKLLAFCLVTLFFITAQLYLFTKVIQSGSIWVILPILVLIINDVSAYVLGSLFGKTKLTKLSPNKTVEGYLGAAAVTVFSSGTKITAFQSHFFFISIIISFIGPFGGFFASGFKRAFSIKDFSDTIPGHGGITDRLDCLPIVCIIVFAYKATFVDSLEADLKTILTLFKKLSVDQQIDLIDKLEEFMKSPVSKYTKIDKRNLKDNRKHILTEKQFMTKKIGEFFDSDVTLKVISSELLPDQTVKRTVCLLVNGLTGTGNTKKCAVLAKIEIFLDKIPENVNKKSIISGEAPLGKILMDSHTPYRCDNDQYFEVNVFRLFK